MPWARATGMGSTVACAAHSKSVCFFDSAIISSPVIVIYNNSIKEIHMRIGIALSLVSFAVLALALVQGGVEAEPGNATLTAVPGIRVGHHTLATGPTG